MTMRMEDRNTSESVMERYKEYEKKKRNDTRFLQNRNEENFRGQIGNIKNLR